MPKRYLEAAVAAAEVSISITYGEQQNRQTTQVQVNQAQASQIQAGGKTTLIAGGAGKQSNINITGSDVSGKAGTGLIADNDITLQSAEQSSSERSNNKSSGWNAGVAVSFGQGGWSLGITAGGNVGKGYGNGDSITHRHSHIGDKGSRTIIQSGGNSTIKGAQVIGQGVQVDAQNLTIQSVQDSESYQSKQQNASAQVTVGYGFSASGSYSQSKINAEHQSVSEQSGIYAGDAGYQVNVKQHTQLDGGIITSSQSAEDNGKNRFITGTLASSDIQNYSRYKGESFGLGASATISGKTLGQGEQNHPQDSHLTSVADKNGTSSSVGYGSDRDNQSSITKSGINTQNIRITDEDKQIQLTGKTAQETKADIYTNTTSETAQQHSGSLKNVFDKEKVQSELDLQRAVSQSFNQNVQAANTEINQRLDQLKAQLEKGEISQSDYDTQVKNWQRGQVLLNSIAAGLSAPTQSTTGIVAATASPALSYEIGQQFKKHNAEGTPAHILAHAVLGAAVAAAGDNNALAGAISAGGAEAAAPIISNYLYNEQDGSKLTAEQKETVTAITNLLGTATGAAIGNSATNAAQGSLNTQSAVENNYISFPNKNDAMQFINIIAPSTPNLKLKVDENNRLVIDGYHYENLDGVLTLVSDETGAPIVLQGKTVFENLLISSMKNPDENKFPITDNPTLYVDSYAKMIWDPSDFNTPNMNDNAQTNKEYQHLANRLLITQPIVERLNSQNYTQNSEEFDKAETELNSILHKYRYNRLKDFLTDVTPIKLKERQGQNLTSEEHNLLQDANLAFQYHTILKMFSDNIYKKGMNVQSDILKEKFPHLKDKIISADKPENYTENGKVVGLMSDFGAVKFIMYTNPEQNQILKTRFIIE